MINSKSIIERKSYLVCKQHNASKAVVEMLVQQLLDFDWHNSQSLTAVYEMFELNGSTAVLRRVTSEDESYCEVNGKQVSLKVYLEAQGRCQKRNATLEDYGTVHETMFRKLGTAETIVLLACDHEIYAVCNGSPDTQALLQEQFDPKASGPSVLYAAFDKEGNMYESDSEDEATGTY
jgi:hypothetical protein